MSNSTVFSRPTDVETPTNFFIDYINEITGGSWSLAISSIVFSVVFLSLNRRTSARRSYAGASFALLINTVILVGLGGLSSQALIIAILLVVLAVVITGGNR
jgi:hypothetical protein